MSLRLKTEEDDTKDRQGLIALAADVALKPIRPFISRPARRAYLTTFLIVLTGFTLLGAAIIAYTLFYWSYIPRIGFERTIYLQFDHVFSDQERSSRAAHLHPYGDAALASDLVSDQNYDVVVELMVPRTRENQDAGNFMIEVTMYAPTDRGSGVPTSGNIMDTVRLDTASPAAPADTSRLLARSRRSAIVPYRSPVTDLLYRFVEMPLYLLNLRDESTLLRIPIFENLYFTGGWRDLPSTLKLEVQSSHRLQIYTARALFRARFRGLRWLMYNHRVICALIFIGGFWTTEMVFAGIAWATVAVYLAKQNQQEVKTGSAYDATGQIKREHDDDPALSDTERTFPTLSGQQPLRYSSPMPDIKLEEDESAIIVPESVARAAEADDEDDDVDFIDSGIGTSMESGGARRRDSVRRRRGRLPGRGEDEKAF